MTTAKQRFYEKHKERLRAEALAYYHAHRDERAAYEQRNAKKIRKRKAAYWKKNHEQIHSRNESWRLSDIRRSVAHRKAYHAFKDDPRAKKCADCGKVGWVDKAHFDYDKPLEIVPLCRPHHRKFDADMEYRERMMGFVVKPVPPMVLVKEA